MQQQDDGSSTTSSGDSGVSRSVGGVGKRADVPMWLTVPLILLLVLGGGLFIVWQWRGGWGSDTVVIDPALAGPRDNTPGARPVARPRPVARSNDGVRRLQRTIHQVRAGQTIVRITERPAPRAPAAVRTKTPASAPAASPATAPTLTFTLRYLPPNVVGPEVQDLVMAGWRLPRERALAEAAKVSREQIAKIRELSIQLDVTLKDADEQRLKTLWSEYQAASAKADAEQRLVAAVAEIGDRELEPRRQAMEQWATQVKGLLTAEQWTAYQQARLAPPRRPAKATATKPATPPATGQATPAALPAAQPAPATPAAPATAPASAPAPEKGV